MFAYLPQGIWEASLGACAYWRWFPCLSIFWIPQLGHTHGWERERHEPCYLPCDMIGYVGNDLSSPVLLVFLEGGRVNCYEHKIW